MHLLPAYHIILKFITIKIKYILYKLNDIYVFGHIFYVILLYFWSKNNLFGCTEKGDGEKKERSMNSREISDFSKGSEGPIITPSWKQKNTKVHVSRKKICMQVP